MPANATELRPFAQEGEFTHGEADGRRLPIMALSKFCHQDANGVLGSLCA